MLFLQTKTTKSNQFVWRTNLKETLLSGTTVVLFAPFFFSVQVCYKKEIPDVPLDLWSLFFFWNCVFKTQRSCEKTCVTKKTFQKVSIWSGVGPLNEDLLHQTLFAFFFFVWIVKKIQIRCVIWLHQSHYLPRGFFFRFTVGRCFFLDRGGYGNERYETLQIQNEVYLLHPRKTFTIFFFQKTGGQHFSKIGNIKLACNCFCFCLLNKKTT